MTDEEKSQLKELVERHASELGEHHDSVRIFVTRHADDGSGGTYSFETGRGNFYAQLGQVREWVAIQDQYQRNWATKKESSDGSDE